MSRAHTGALRWGPEIFGYTIGDRDEDLSFDTREQCGIHAKCVVVDPNFDWKGQPAGVVSHGIAPSFMKLM